MNTSFIRRVLKTPLPEDKEYELNLFEAEIEKEKQEEEEKLTQYATEEEEEVLEESENNDIKKELVALLYGMIAKDDAHKVGDKLKHMDSGNTQAAIDLMKDMLGKADHNAVEAVFSGENLMKAFRGFTDGIDAEGNTDRTEENTAYYRQKVAQLLPDVLAKIGIDENTVKNISGSYTKAVEATPVPKPMEHPEDNKDMEIQSDKPDITTEEKPAEGEVKKASVDSFSGKKTYEEFVKYFALAYANRNKVPEEKEETQPAEEQPTGKELPTQEEEQ